MFLLIAVVDTDNDDFNYNKGVGRGMAGTTMAIPLSQLFLVPASAPRLV